ncbi:hypothetical protein Droror1_Dr00007167 [Drosera rotundifolia]
MQERLQFSLHWWCLPINTMSRVFHQIDTNPESKTSSASPTSNPNDNKKIRNYLIDLRKMTNLLGMVKALEIVFTEESAVLGLPAKRHTFVEIVPEIVASSQ